MNPAKPGRRNYKIGAKVVRHGRYAVLQMAAAIPPYLFAGILRLIAEPRPPPAAASTGSLRFS
jgi:hypothetical protein